jgi:hypothetical protein
MALTLTVTSAGRAALVNADNNGTAPVLIAKVGLTATAVTPHPTDTVLPGEHKRIATLSGGVVADDTIHVIVRDESSDVYTVRSVGLYLADDTLFGIYGQAEVLLEKSAKALLLLPIDVKFEDIAAATISFGDANFLNPPATTTTQGVVELATEAEAETGVDTVRAVTPKGMKAAVTSWLNSRFGEGAPSAFMKGLLTTASKVAFRQSLDIKSAALKDEGAGNNLDADLLDGQHGSWYADILSRLGFTPVQQGGGTGQGTNKIRIGWSGTRVKAQVDGVDQGNIVFDAHMTKGNVGLGNVDNTSDVAKPVSTATQSALNGKIDLMSAARPGVTRLYRRDDDSAFNVQVTWDGGRWFLRGYNGDAFHGECRVSFANSADYAGAAGSVAWGNVSGRPTSLSAFVNDTAYITGGGRAFPRRSDGDHLNFNWSGQGGQPQWLWGGNDGNNMYVYNPSNFNVNYANGAGNADTVDGYHASDLAKYADFAQSLGGTGYMRLPGGLILQWGTFTATANSGGSITYPIQFASWGLPFPSGPAGTNGDGSATENGVWPTARSNSGFNYFTPQNTSWASWWFAIGV